MTFPFTCSACGYVNHFEWSQIGQKISCGGCEKPMTVPVPMETVGPPEPLPARKSTFRCPSCRRKFATKPELAGKKIRCTGCGAGIRVPRADEESVVQPSHAMTADDSAKSALSFRTGPATGSLSGVAAPSVADDEATHEPPLDDQFAWIKKARRRKPPKAVLPSRAELIEQVNQKNAEDAAAQEQARIEKAKKKSKKKKKGASYFDLKETLQLIAGVSALVGFIAFLAWGYPGMRFPLGGFLCVIGFIVYLLGSSSLRRLVADEGVLKLLLYRFCPPYQWWYIIRNWQETKDFFAFFIAGYAIMALGGGIIKTSEEGRRAEKEDRAYQKFNQSRQVQPPPPVFKRMERDDD